MSNLLNFPIRSLPRWWKRSYTIAVIVLLSILIHAWAAWQLPIDADEPTYMSAAQSYAALVEQGDLRGVIDYPVNREHPPLVKLVYSLPFYFTGSDQFPVAEFYANRAISAFFGVLQVLLLSLVDPLAGFLLALHSMTIKYTSEVYLEAIPLFFSLAAVFAFLRASQPPGEGQPAHRRWLWISAASLGIAVAGKYTYALIGLPIAFLALTRRTVTFRRLVLYGLLAVTVFWLFNPYLWSDPLHRLRDIFSFHASYTQSIDVQRANYPWYQPFLWISNSVPWHPQVFFFLTSDELVFWVSLFGLYIVGRRHPWLIVWTVGIFAILLVYPTKWPQYTLILYPALAMLASGTIRWLVTWGREKNEYWDYLEEMLPQPPRVFWWLLIGLVVALVIGKVGYEATRAFDRRGWSVFTADLSPLPSNVIYDIEPGADGQMILATSQGVAFWNPTETSPWGEEIRTLTRENSGLASNRVLDVLEDSQGRLWFGTDRGVSRLDGADWARFLAADLGLAGEDVRSLAEDGQGGIWVGTTSGLAHWDGSAWQAYTAQNSPLLDNTVFSVAVQPSEAGGVVWAGTKSGISRFDLAADAWQVDDFSDRSLGWSGVSDILVDSQNRVWAATLGGGLAMWDGSQWTFYRVGTSGIPTSVVQEVIEIQPGVVMLGLGFPTEPGGLLARFDGSEWTRFGPNNSGFTGGEPLALALDPSGSLWIGTAADGLQIYQPQQ